MSPRVSAIVDSTAGAMYEQRKQLPQNCNLNQLPKTDLPFCSCLVLNESKK